MCCILKGGHQYFADLVNEIKKLRRNNGTSVQLSLEFIRVKSYTNDTSGGVHISLTDQELKEFKDKVTKKKNRKQYCLVYSIENLTYTIESVDCRRYY